MSTWFAKNSGSNIAIGVNTRFTRLLFTYAIVQSDLFSVFIFREKFPAGRTDEYECCYMGQIIEESNTTELSDNVNDAQSWHHWNILSHIQVGWCNITNLVLLWSWCSLFNNSLQCVSEKCCKQNKLRRFMWCVVDQSSSQRRLRVEKARVCMGVFSTLVSW